MPLSLAAQADENTTAFDDCVNRMEKEFPNVAQERLEERCQQYRTVANIAKKANVSVREVAKVATATATQERLQQQLEKVSANKEKILEGLSEEQKNKLASLDRARIEEFAQKNSADIKEALDKLRVVQVKKEEAFKKRVVAKEKIETAKQKYAQAKNRYADAKENYTEAKNSWEKAVKARNDADAITYGKIYLTGASEMVIASLEKVRSQIESNDDLTEAEAEEALAEIDAKIAEMEQAKEQVMNASTKEEVKAASRTIQQAWERIRVRLAVQAEKQVQTSVGEILSRSTALEQHLERILAQMEADGVNGTETIDAHVEAFSQKIADARETYAESTKLFDEAKETNSTELLDESKTLSREAHDLLKEAQQILVTIVQEVKAQGYSIEDDSEYVSIIEENTSDEDGDAVACCMAITADCLACSAGLSVDDYCVAYPETIGCASGLDVNETELNETGLNETEEGD